MNAGEVYDIMTKWDFSSLNGVYFIIYQNRFQILSSHGSNPVIKSDNDLSADTWYYVALTMDSSSMSLYINGVYHKSGTSRINLTPNDIKFRIGFNEGLTTAQRYFNGSIDEVLIFNRSLSLEAVQALYDN